MQFGRGLDDGAHRPLRRHVRERADVRLRRRGTPGCAELLAAPRRSASTRARSSSSFVALVTGERAVVLSAVRTPVGRYGGALSGVRPDDLAATRDRARRSSARASPPDGDRGRLLRLRQPGRRGQPQRRAHGRAARGAARVRRRRHGEPALRVGARGRRRRVSRRRRGRRRPLRRRRRRVDVARAARAWRSPTGVPARQPDGLRHDARLALPEPAAGGDVPARVDGRDRRERRRALRRLARGAGRVRARSRSSAGRPRPRRAASTTSSSRSATSMRDEHPRPDTTSRSSRRSSRPSARAAR